ncbi:MAG: DUF4870 domain-containing protein [Candidatus ainarchaeum sp.]|nr:DUF4870 domain-containing protein [Candidatus ainarchaeum sp.]
MAAKKGKVQSAAPAEEKAEARKESKSSPENDSNLMAALSYIINLIGLPVSIVLYLVKKEDSFVRFHALQATALWVALFLIGIIAMVLLVVISVVTMGFGGILGICVLPLGLIFLLLDLYLAYLAYQGQKYKIPVIGDFVEKYV